MLRTIGPPVRTAAGGSLSDESKSVGVVLATRWETVTRSGLVTFANRLSPATTATFDVPGTYALRFTA